MEIVLTSTTEEEMIAKARVLQQNEELTKTLMAYCVNSTLRAETFQELVLLHKKRTWR